MMLPVDLFSIRRKVHVPIIGKSFWVYAVVRLVNLIVQRCTQIDGSVGILRLERGSGLFVFGGLLLSNHFRRLALPCAVAEGCMDVTEMKRSTHHGTLYGRLVLYVMRLHVWHALLLLCTI